MTLNLKSDVNVKRTALKFILGILNSSLIKYLYNWKLDEDGKVYPQVKKVNIEWFPIPKFKNENLIALSLDDIIALNIKDEKCSTKFITYLNSKITNVTSNSKKLESWSELTFAEFIAEINKSLKTSGQSLLSKKDEFDWLDLFEENKTKAQSIKSQIETTEKAIDAMVYELYSLSDQEITIIENS